LSSFENIAADQTLYRLALPAACGSLDIPGASNQMVLEWHGQQRWIRAAGDEATFTLIKQLATSHGGHATRFKQGANVNPAFQRFTLLGEQVHSKALETVQERLRSAFDPAGVFATKRLP
jgi:glycolate oxidase FAD binding subunit